MICVLLADDDASVIYVGVARVPEFQHTMAGGLALVRKSAPLSVRVVWPDPTLTFVGLIDCSNGTGFAGVEELIRKFSGFDSPLLPAPE